MKENELILGIDISKKTLDVAISSGGILEHCKIENTKQGIKKLIRSLLKRKQSIFCCFENTGVYSFPLCVFLQEQGIAYSMVNPLTLKRSMGITRGKTDKADAKMIAKYAVKNRNELPEFKLPMDSILELKLLISERSKYIKAIKMFGSMSESIGFVSNNILKKAARESKKTIDFLKKRKKKVEEQMLHIIQEDTQMNEQFNLVRSIPGVGTQTAIELISATNCFTNFSDSRKFACYVGIAPFEYQSGSSIRGRTKVSPIANKKLKATLSMAALTAKKWDPQLKHYYERKIKEGKNGMLVMNAIRNKLVHRIFATIKRGTPYVKLENFAA